MKNDLYLNAKNRKAIYNILLDNAEDALDWGFGEKLLGLEWIHYFGRGQYNVKCVVAGGRTRIIRLYGPAPRG